MRDESGAVSSETTVTPRLDGIEGFILGSAIGFTVRVRGDLNYQVGTLYTLALTGESKIKDYIIQKISPKDEGYVSIELMNYDPAIYAPDTETPPSHETTLIQVTLDAVPSAQEHPDHTFQLSTPSVETLAWNAAPTGTYEADRSGFFAKQQFTVSDLGGWSVTGAGDTFDTGSGDYRPGVVGQDEVNYEIRITASTTGGSGSVAALGGIVFGTWKTLEGGEGISVTDAVTGVTTVNITVEIREIATPANTTGVASFTFDVDGDPPI